MYILTPIIHSLYKYDHSTFVNTTYKFKSIDLYYKLTHYNILISIQTSKRRILSIRKKRKKKEEEKRDNWCNLSEFLFDRNFFSTI